VCLTESIVLFQVGNLFGILIGFKFLEAFDPKVDLFTMLLFDSGEKLAAISVVRGHGWIILLV
jgi:hypothetical protein